MRKSKISRMDLSRLDIGNSINNESSAQNKKEASTVKNDDEILDKFFSDEEPLSENDEGQDHIQITKALSVKTDKLLKGIEQASWIMNKNAQMIQSVRTRGGEKLDF